MTNFDLPPTPKTPEDYRIEANGMKQTFQEMIDFFRRLISIPGVLIASAKDFEAETQRTKKEKE